MIYIIVPNLIGRIPLRGAMRGVLRLQFAKNEARLVPILHNGRVPPPECICPPRVQLTLVTKGIMDIRFQYGAWYSSFCTPVLGTEGTRAARVAPTISMGAWNRTEKESAASGRVKSPMWVRIPLLPSFQRFLFVGISLPERVAEKPRQDGLP
jgi:hypothetical protein